MKTREPLQAIVVTGVNTSQPAFWTAPAERSGDGAFGRTSGPRNCESVSCVRKRRGASLPAAVQDGCLTLPADVPKGQNLNSHGREPMERRITHIRPLRGRTISDTPNVGFTHGYSGLAASRPFMRGLCPSQFQDALRFFLLLALFLCLSTATAATNSATWDTTARLATSFGYRDNVLRSSIAPVGSAFLNTSGDVSFLRFSDSGAHFTLFLLADDTRYFDAASGNYEQFFSGTAQATTPLGDRDELGGQFTYLYQHQVVDVYDIESLHTRMLVNGHSLALRPHWKHTLGGGWAAQLEVSGSRQLYDGDLDDFWDVAGRLSAIRSYGHRSEFSLGYQVKQLRYDTREQSDSSGFAVPGTSLRYWQHELATQWRHHWDEARHWRSTSKLGYQISRDNGSGYFDYDRVVFSQQLRWAAAPWEIKATGRLGWGRYDTQLVGTEHRERSYAAVDLRVERRLGKHWLIYAAAEREWNFSNDPLDEYRDWMASAGVGVEF
jgi:hypothetical protein